METVKYLTPVGILTDTLNAIILKYEERLEMQWENTLNLPLLDPKSGVEIGRLYGYSPSYCRLNGYGDQAQIEVVWH